MIMTMIWDNEKLLKYLKDRYFGHVVFFYELQEICSIDYISSNSNIQVNDSKYKDRVVDALDSSGLTRLETTLLPLGDKEIEIRRIDANWNGWFLEKAAAEALIVVVLDTNFTRRNYGTNILLAKLGERFSRINIRIPNLVVFEIEDQYNRAKNKQKRIINVETKKKAETEIREAYYALIEIMRLLENGAQLLSHANWREISTFSQGSSVGFADKYIRREIHDSIFEQGNYLVNFLTCDLMNALAARAEGTRTFYFLRLDDGIVEADIKQLASFIHNLAIKFGKFSMKVTKDDKTEEVELEGMWSGKNPLHWKKSCLRVTTGKQPT